VVSARVEEQHRTCCCRLMRAAVRMYRMLAEEAVAELRRIEGQEGVENAPSRAADGLAGPGILIVTDLRAPENGTETARTPPTTPDPSDKGTL